MAKYNLFPTQAEKYRDNPFRESFGPSHRTDAWGRKIFSDGTTYRRDWLSGKTTVKKPPYFW